MNKQERKEPATLRPTGQGRSAWQLLLIATLLMAVLASTGAVAFAGRLTDTSNTSKSSTRISEVDAKPLTGASKPGFSGQRSAVAPRIPDAKNPPTQPLDEAFIDLVPGVDHFGSCPDSRCTGTCLDPSTCNPNNGDSVNTGDRFVLDLMLNTGTHTDASAQQTYMTYTNDLIRVGNVLSMSTSCVLTGTLNPDSTTFDAALQNEWCNGEAGPCTFRGLTVDPGMGSFASGALNNPGCQAGCGGVFRVAEM